jgi:hypothetical protein
MNDEWKKYPNDRMMRVHPEGFVIVIPDDHENSVPLACELCSSLFRSSDDVTEWREFGCCFACAQKFAHPDREKWKNGHRPTKEQIELHLSERPRITIKL